MSRILRSRGAAWALGVAVAAVLSISAGPAAAAIPSGNLLANGNAEEGEGATDDTSVKGAPGWTTSSNFTEHVYDGDGFPQGGVSQSIGGDSQFFIGGPNANNLNTIETATQPVDVTGAAAEIDAGHASVSLAAYLGGYDVQEDNAQVTATFLDAGNADLGHLTIGPVGQAERGGATTLIRKASSLPVPAGTRTIRVQITMTKDDGAYNDATADNVSLTMFANDDAGGGSDPGPTAQFAPATTSAHVGDRVFFDARQTTSQSPVQGYEWDFTGDGKPEATCTGQNPLVTTSFIGAGATTVSLTVTDGNGARSVTSQPYEVTRRAGGEGARVHAAKPTRVHQPHGTAYQLTQCVSAPTLDDTAATGCEQRQLQFDIVDAEGCFVVIEGVGKLPSSEFNTIWPVLLSASTGTGLSTINQYCPYVTCGPPDGSGKVRAAASLTQALTTAAAAVVTRTQGRVWVSDEPVRINGLTYTPRGNAKIVLVAGAPLAGGASFIASSNAEISMSGNGAPAVVLQRGRIRQQVDLAHPQKRFVRFSSEDIAPSGLKFLPKMPIEGEIDATLVKYGTQIDTYVRLPGFFKDDNGQGLSASIRFRLDRTGFNLDGLAIDIPKLVLWNVTAALHLKYTVTNPAKTLFGDLILEFPLTSNSDRVEGKLSIQNGEFSSASLDWDAGAGGGFPVFPGLFLISLHGGFRIDPTEADAGAVASLGEATTNGCGAADVSGHILLHLSPDPLRVRADGQGRILCINAGTNVYLEASSDGTLGFGGGLDYSFAGIFSIRGGVKALFDWNGGDPHFQADGKAEACLGNPLPIGPDRLCSGEFHASASDKGIAVCHNFIGDWQTGFGLPWPPPVVAVLSAINPALMIPWVLANVEFFAKSCDIGPWRTIRSARAARADGSRTLDIAAGQRGTTLEIHGEDDAPEVELRDPKGGVISMPADGGALRTENAIAFRVPGQKTTYVAVAKPAGGKWTVSPREGSTAVTGVRQAGVLPEPVVKGRVDKPKRGTRARRLHYAIKPISGQRVTFFEKTGRGLHTLGRAKGRRGTLRFTPADFAASRRTVVARVEQGAFTRRNITIATFKASTGLGKPRGLRLRRRASKLVVTWKAVAGADRYNVSVALSDGRRLPIVAKKRRVTVSKVGSRVTGVVLVSGQRGSARRGPVARAKLRRAAKRRR